MDIDSREVDPENLILEMFFAIWRFVQYIFVFTHDFIVLSIIILSVVWTDNYVDRRS